MSCETQSRQEGGALGAGTAPLTAIAVKSGRDRPPLMKLNHAIKPLRFGRQQISLSCDCIRRSEGTACIDPIRLSELGFVLDLVCSPGDGIPSHQEVVPDLRHKMNRDR